MTSDTKFEVGQAVVIAHPDLIAAGTVVRCLGGNAYEAAVLKRGLVVEVEASHMTATTDLADAEQVALSLDEHQLRYGG